MLLTKGLALIWILTIADAGQSGLRYISYSALRYGTNITVGSSVTTDYATSWISPSGRFAFGFYYEKDGFSVGIQLFAYPSETAVVWTARPDLKRFTKDAFLNFTKKGLFVTPEKDAEALPLFSFSSTATAAAMLDIGNFVVFGTNDSSVPKNFSDHVTWRSFDYPTDTILGSQFLPCGYNLTSSSGKTNHSIGEHILNLPCGGANLISYRLNSADKNWDIGLSGGDYRVLNLDGNGRLYLTSFGGNEKDLSVYKPDNTNDDMLYRATLDPDTIFRLYALNLRTNSTMVVNEIPYYKDKCQNKDICGVNSYCFLANSNAQCNCMPGFVYINPESQFAGCRGNKTVPRAVSAGAILSMEAVDNIVGMDELAYGIISTESQEECSNACLSDCNCDAASFIDQKCSKLKLPLTSGRRDSNYQSVALIKLAGAGGTQLAATGQQRRFREEWRKWELALTEEIAPRYFSYKELLKGSIEFKHKLGKGGQGTVFRADLLIGDRFVAVAVKKLYGAEMEGEREFQAEMRLIGRAYHTNIVRLLGFCHDGPSRLIVYELMSRGSLADHIFESSSRRPSWERRVAILLHAARGIHYLHRECETKTIHRDIKPENILIAEDWTAKIADFGIAKLLNRNQTRAATRTLAAGTEGYVAPECERAVDETGEAQVTEKADVYSYGMVVLETICSKRNREVKPSLCELVRKSYEDNELWKLVEGEQVEAFQLEKLVKMGLLCVQEDPSARPLMEDVVMMLEGYIDVPTLLQNQFSL